MRVLLIWAASKQLHASKQRPAPLQTRVCALARLAELMDHLSSLTWPANLATGCTSQIGTQ